MTDMLTAEERQLEAERGAELRVHSAEGLPKMLGIEITETARGRVVGRVPAAGQVKTSYGTLHGGVTAAFVDHLLGGAALLVSPPERQPVTLEFKLNYIAPVTEGDLEGVAEVVAQTGRTVVVRVTLSNNNRVVGLGQGTWMLVKPSNV